MKGEIIEVEKVKYLLFLRQNKDKRKNKMTIMIEEYKGKIVGHVNYKNKVQLHQSEFWVESVIEQGTTFYFTLQNVTV